MTEVLESIPWQQVGQLTGAYGQAVAIVLLTWLWQRQVRLTARLADPVQQSCAERLVKSMRASPNDWRVEGATLKHTPTNTTLSIATGQLNGPEGLSPFGYFERRRLRREMLGVLARHVEKPSATAHEWRVAVTAPSVGSGPNPQRPNAGPVPKV
jgi:hypothetical protein